MTKQKKKPQSNKTNKPLRVNQRNTPINQPLAPATQPIVPKRQIGDLSLFFRRQESISPPTVEQRFSLQHFIKSTSIQVLVLQCVELKMALEKISSKISVDRNLLYSIAQKYLHGTKNQLWCDKYRPLNLNESLHSQMGEKIKSWLRVFYSYRNTVFEQSNSFIDDYFGQNSNNIEFKLLKQYGWRLRGLIIKGRQGVGKATAIKCTAKQMQYEILSCGNQCNQIKFLKQKNEATQSECVKTKINKNQTQIQRTNRSITTFAVQKQQPELQTQQSKRIQLMRNVNQFFPRQDETKFFNQLNKTIQSSKIPFIMTINGQDVPENLSKPQKNNSNQQKYYDVIEFQQAKTQDIAMLLYLIYHVEIAFSKCLDLEKIVQKEKFKEIFNEQLARFQFQIKSPYIDFIKLTEIFNKKLVPLFTFMQSSILCSKCNKKSIKNDFNYEINLNKAQQQMEKYLQRVNPTQLMNDYFLVQPPSSSSINQIKQQQASKDFSSTMQISKYLIDTSINEEKKNIDAGDIPTFVCTPNKEQFLNMQNDCHSRTKTIVKNKQQQLSQKQQKISQSSQSQQKPFSQTLRELKMKVISDYNHSVISDQCYIFNKLYNQSRDQLEQQTIHNIPIQKHKIIRKQILHNVKKQFYARDELNTTMKQKQLNFLGFLIDSRARVSRKKNTIKQQLNLKKLLKQNQINYMKSFTDFVRPNSMENNIK